MVAGGNALKIVDRYFQFSLLGLVASGFFALAGTGRLDSATVAFMSVALTLRAFVLSGWVRFSVPPGAVVAAAVAYALFYPIDFLWLSQDFFTATVHGVCFLAAVKVLTGKTERDLPYTFLVAFVELVAAALLSSQSGYVLWLGCFLLFSIAVFTSGEIRRGLSSGLQLAPPVPGLNRRLAVVAAVSLTGMLVVAAGFFVIVPRTARAAAILFPGSARLSGFSGVVDLGVFGSIAKDDRAVAHVLSYGRPLPLNLKWRGTTLSRFDGRRWFEPVTMRGQSVPLASGTAEVADRNQRSRRDGRRLLYRVDSGASGNGTLFIAGIPEYINLATPRLTRRPGNTWQASPQTSDSLRYEVSALLGEPLPEPITPAERARYLALPAIDDRIYLLAEEWSGEGAPSARARRIEEHLRRDFRYTLESSPARTRDPLARFLFIDRKGYCEYFASAMAVMLRSIGIPSRVVTGFQSGYYNHVSGMTVLRASDAHAWVEGWFPEHGWVTFDPTPSTLASDSGIFGRMNMYLDAVDSVWQQWVVAYDLGRQANLAARLESFVRSRQGKGIPSVSSSFSGLHVIWPWLAVCVCVPGLVWFGPRIFRLIRGWFWLHRVDAAPASSRDVTRLYELMLKKADLTKPSGITPAAFALSLPDPGRQRVVEFTEQYNRARFGGSEEEVSQMADMLRNWSRNRGRI